MITIILSVIWSLFTHVLERLPALVYAVLAFVIGSVTLAFAGNVLPGFPAHGSLGWTLLSLATLAGAVVGQLPGRKRHTEFAQRLGRRLARLYPGAARMDTPGIVFLEIDGLSEPLLRRAIAEGHMPTLARWLKRGSHRIIGWETDFSSQTGAMQMGILMGDNHDIPAYRWWDRQLGRMVLLGDPRDTQRIEAERSTGHGLLREGGASRGNMFSGDADESMLTYSTLLDSSRSSGPGFFSLLTPLIALRLTFRYFGEVGREWWEAFQQWRRRDRYTVSARNPFYAFFRAFIGAVLQDLTTLAVMADIRRGVPAVYALYAGYDDIAHFAGMTTPEAFALLRETDHAFARIERATRHARRPYHLVVLSDHGQSEGPTFASAYGISLEKLVQGLIKGDEKVFAAVDTDEAWNNLNLFLSASVSANTRTARVVRRALRSRTRDGWVNVRARRAKGKVEAEPAQQANLAVFGSGCAGLIYFTEAKERLTYEQIQDLYPDLIIGLVNHPGLGFVVVKSEEHGTMAMAPTGIHYVDLGVVEGKDPLAPYGPRAAEKVRRQSSFTNCPDIFVNTAYDPATQELAGFENQCSHHGGLGGPQNQAFILYPTTLPYDGQPIVGAESVHRLLCRARQFAQYGPAPAETPVETGSGVTVGPDRLGLAAYEELEIQGQLAENVAG